MNRRSFTLPVVIVGALCVAAAAWRLASVAPLGARPSMLPRDVIWAWDRADDLRFVDPESTGIAMFVGSVWLVGDRAVLEPRRHAITLPSGVRPQVVVRLETSRQESPTLSNRQRLDAAAAILSLHRFGDGHGLQIDFDATRSQRRFYAELLEELRNAMPPEQPLSIAALASWCQDDTWLDQLAIDEAVPMLYRMGSESASIRLALDRGADFAGQRCQTSLGVSSDEPIPRLPKDRRLYYFHPEPWTASALAELVAVARPSE